MAEYRGKKALLLIVSLPCFKSPTCVFLQNTAGTKVAIKRILPNKQPGMSNAPGSIGRGSRGSLGSMDRGEKNSKISNDSADIEAPAPCDNASNSMEPDNRDSVMYSRSITDESETDSDLDFLGGLSAGRRRSKWAKWFPWLNMDGEAKYNASILGSASGSHNSTSRTIVNLVCPWFDEHSRRKQEFEVEMRLLSRLRHPCEFSTSCLFIITLF